MLRQLLSAADPVHLSGARASAEARGCDGDLCYGGGMSDNVKPKPLFARLTLPANAVDVTADAAITAVIGAGRYTLEEQAIHPLHRSRPARPAADTGVDIDVPRSGAGIRPALDLSPLRAVSWCTVRFRRVREQPPRESRPASDGLPDTALVRSRCRLPITRQLLRFRELRGRHLRGDHIPTFHRVFVTTRRRQV
jgi:hypothetical protein